MSCICSHRLGSQYTFGHGSLVKYQCKNQKRNKLWIWADWEKCMHCKKRDKPYFEATANWARLSWVNDLLLNRLADCNCFAMIKSSQCFLLRQNRIIICFSKLRLKELQNMCPESYIIIWAVQEILAVQPASGCLANCLKSFRGCQKQKQPSPRASCACGRASYAIA